MMQKSTPMICLSDLLPSTKTQASATFDFRLFEEIEEGSTAQAVELSSLKHIRKKGLQEIFSCAVVTYNAHERVFTEIIEFLKKKGLKEMPYLLVVTNRYMDKQFTNINLDAYKIYSRLFLMITFDEKERPHIMHRTILSEEAWYDANS